MTVSASSRNSTVAMPVGRHDQGRALEGHADERHLDAAREAVDGVGREDRLAAVLVLDVGGEEVEVGAAERVAVTAAVDGMAPVPARRAYSRPRGCRTACAAARRCPRRTRGCRRRCSRGPAVERLDGRLVVEQRRQQRRRADQVAGRDEDRVAVLGAQVADVRREVLDATGRDATGGVHAPAARAPMRPPELAVGSTTSSCPWKSLSDRIWTETAFGRRCRPWASAVVAGIAISDARATADKANTRVRERNLTVISPRWACPPGSDRRWDERKGPGRRRRYWPPHANLGEPCPRSTLSVPNPVRCASRSWAD